MAWYNPMTWGAGTVNPLSVTRDRTGNIFYKMFSSSGSFTSPTTDRDKLILILRNPAVLKVFKLNCDLASLGRVAEYKNDVFESYATLKQMQAKPNKHQTWKQFFWDYEFYNMLGTAYLWRSNNTNLSFSNTSFYWLNPAKIEFDGSLENKLDRLDLSDKAVNDIGKEYIRYRFKDGTQKQIPLKEIQPFFDLSNSVSENWYKGSSAIDALYKVISNSDMGLDAKNVNLDFSKKYFVTGTQDPNDTTQLPMGEDEKKSIREKLGDQEPVKVTKSMIDIKRFVDDIAKLRLDDSYIADYFIIGSMYGIPRDVLEANLKGITYENQEKSTGKHISYSIQPKMDDLMEWLGSFLNVDLRMEYKHLPFMQYVEKDRAEVIKTKAESFKIFLDAGIEVNDALTLAGVDYEGTVKEVTGKSSEGN